VQAPDSRIAFSSSSTLHARQHAFETMVSVSNHLKFQPCCYCLLASVHVKEGRYVGRSACRCCADVDMRSYLIFVVTSRVFDRVFDGALVAAGRIYLHCRWFVRLRTNRERNDVGVHSTIWDCERWDLGFVKSVRTARAICVLRSKCDGKI
jgi:hypothetical protein